MDRVLALDYAEKHWDRPCHDGEIMLDERALRVRDERIRLKLRKRTAGKLVSFRMVGGTEKRRRLSKSRRPGGVTIPGLPGKWLKKTIQEWAGLERLLALFVALLDRRKGRCAGAGEAASLIKALQKLSVTKAKTLVEKVSKGACQRVIDSGIFQPGDFIGYFNTGDYNSGQRVRAQHDVCRRPADHLSFQVSFQKSRMSGNRSGTWMSQTASRSR